MFEQGYGKTLLGLSAALLLSGCAMTAEHASLTRPDATAVQQLSEVVAAPNAERSTQADWWRGLDNAGLNQLVERALHHNRDLQAAALQLEAQLARLDVARDQRRPQGGLAGSASLSRAQRAGAGLDVTRQESISLGLAADWQLDLFGRISARIRQAEAELEQRQAVRASLLAEVVSGVVATHTRLAGTSRQLALLERQLASLEESLAVMRLRVEEGVATPLELNRALALQHEYRARQPELQEAEARYRETLATLVGVNTHELGQMYVAELPALESLRLQLEQPEQALLEAPELRQARAQVARAMALSDQAQAALYPELSLTGVLGWLSGFSLVLGDAREQLGITPQLRWSLLNLSALRAGLSAAQLEEQAVLAEYENSLLRVLNRADRAVKTWDARGRRLTELTARQTYAVAAFDQAQARYEEGALLYMDYLDAQRDLLESESTLVQAQSAWLESYVELQQAFPGHWVPLLPVQG